MKIVILSAGRFFEEWCSLPLNKKLERVKQIIDQYFDTDEFKTLVSENHGKLCGIFVMPEYALNEFNEDFEVEPLTKEEIKYVEKFIQTQCAKEGLLIVPGTGLYQKEFNDNKRHQVNSKWEKFREQHLHLYHDDNVDTMTKMLNEEVEEVNNTTDTTYQRNVILALSPQGKYLLRKIDNVTDTKEGTIFIPGIKIPSFQCMDKEVGLYICNDMAQGYILKNNSDINIVVSDEINLLDVQQDEISDNKTLLPQTLIVHACTRAQQCIVMLEGKAQEEANTESTSFGEIKTYNVELPSCSLTNVI